MKYNLLISAFVSIVTLTSSRLFCQSQIKSTNLYNNLNKCCGPNEDEAWVNYIAPNNDKYEIKCSSTLPNQGIVSYDAKNLDDAKITTAWAEGDSEYGIGTTIEFVIKESFGTILKGDVNTISGQIVNGYYKTDKNYLENSRVKSFNYYLNGKLISIVELNDFRGIQQFEIKTPLKKGDVLKFEIKDVYKGTKFKDVLITEFRFD